MLLLATDKKKQI